MSDGAFPIKKVIPIIVVTWILSLVTTLAVAYFTPFVPVGTNQIGDSAVVADKIADSAIITAKLADGNVTSAKILDGTITAVDLADGSIITVTIANGAVTTTKIADGAVTTDKLASGAIPFNSTYGTYDHFTSATEWEEIPQMSVTITLPRKSHLLIFSTVAVYVNPDMHLWIAAYVINSTTTQRALPIYMDIFPGSIRNPYACNFYLPSVSAGTYTVKIMWQLMGTGAAGVRDRTLTVIALPA